MSFSVPLESWKSYCAIMARTGGTFVLRGIPKHSFPALIQKVKELREAGVLAPIDIDPSLFEEFGIDSVPAVVISEGDKHDKILGNFQLNASLEEAAESGDTKQLSLTLFKRLKGHI
jgi:conjugal transfer pilus assembly protein TrbC